jgi:hypothetical protein
MSKPPYRALRVMLGFLAPRHRGPTHDLEQQAPHYAHVHASSRV